MKKYFFEGEKNTDKNGIEWTEIKNVRLRIESHNDIVSAYEPCKKLFARVRKNNDKYDRVFGTDNNINCLLGIINQL